MISQHALEALPNIAGTYLLILHLPASTRLTIGSLGEVDFPAGYYVYIGSAFGVGGLRGRLKHHLLGVTKPHWHIDYLRTAARMQQIWYAADVLHGEHQWATTLNTLPIVTVPVPRFGASDCRCATHLIHLEAAPAFTTLCEVLSTPLRCWSTEGN